MELDMGRICRNVWHANTSCESLHAQKWSKRAESENPGSLKGIKEEDLPQKDIRSK